MDNTELSDYLEYTKEISGLEETDSPETGVENETKTTNSTVDFICVNAICGSTKSSLTENHLLGIKRNKTFPPDPQPTIAMEMDNESLPEFSERLSYSSLINKYKPTNLIIRMGHSFRRRRVVDKEDNPQNDVQNALHGELSGFSLQMMGLGSSIGTGLLIASGQLLSEAGILPVLIGYILVSSSVFASMQALGELSVAIPVSGSFIKYSIDFIDRSWAYTIGWNYAVQWMTLLPLELVASTIVIENWTFIKLDRWVLLTIFYVITCLLNLFTIKYFGFFEIGFSLIKIVAILMFIIVGFALVVGIFSDPIGFRYIKDPGFVRPDINALTIINVLITASFSFAGSELVGLAAIESSDPVREVPKAIKQLIWRILFFYMTSLVLIGLLVPYNHQLLMNPNNPNNDVNESPFVIALSSYFNSKVLSIGFNCVILISILAVTHSATYASSRALASLSENDMAPKCLDYVDKKGRPVLAALISLSAGLLSYLSILWPNGSKIMFEWLMSIGGLSVIFSYSTICYCHIRFRKTMQLQQVAIEELSFRASLGKYGSYYGLCFGILIMVGKPILGFIYESNWINILQDNLCIISMALTFGIHKLATRTKVAKIEEYESVRDILSRPIRITRNTV